jgi:hypothetical protein
MAIEINLEESKINKNNRQTSPKGEFDPLPSFEISLSHHLIKNEM